MTKVLMIANCRCDSRRVPNKVILNFGGKPAFVQVLERGLQGYPNPDHVTLVTPQQMVNDPAEMLARQYGYDTVRYLREQSGEQLHAFDHYGLKDDDIYIPLSGDSPLAYNKHLAFAVEKLQEHDAQRAIPIRRRGTLGWAAYASEAWRVGLYRHVVPLQTIWEHGITYGDLEHHGKCVLIELPSYLDEPWPWGPLHVDWPIQAVAMKAIYEELYDGEPIDVRDVVELYRRKPMLAGMVPVDAPVGAKPAFPHGSADVVVETIKNIGNYVEVKFEEGGDVE